MSLPSPYDYENWQDFASALLAALGDGIDAGGVPGGSISGTIPPSSLPPTDPNRVPLYWDVLLNLISGGPLWIEPPVITPFQVDTQSLANAAVELAILADTSVDTAKLFDLAVVNSKIANATILSAKIGDLQVVTGKINDLAVNNAKISDLAVSTAKIGDAQITMAKIAALAVGTAAIQDAAVINAKIGDTIQSFSWNDVTKAGWKIDKNGNIQGRGLAIYDNTGALIFGSGGGLWSAITGAPTMLRPIGSFTTVQGTTVTKSGGTHGAYQGGAVGVGLTGSAFIRSSILAAGVGGSWVTALSLDNDQTTFGDPGGTDQKYMLQCVVGLASPTSATFYLYVDGTLVANSAVAVDPVGPNSHMALVYDGVKIFGTLDGVQLPGITYSTGITAGQTLYPKVISYYNDAILATPGVRDVTYGPFSQNDTTSLGGTQLVNLATNIIGQMTAGNISTFIAGAAIGTALIGNAAITTALINAAAITTALIGDAQVVNAKIADGTIQSAKIANLVIDKVTAGTLDAVIDMGTGLLRFTIGGNKLVIGKGFGSTSQFIMWFGPSMTESAMTETTAIFYLKTNGSAYFGGTLAAGVLKNAVVATTHTHTDTAEIGSFGSNGGQRQYVASIDYTWDGLTQTSGDFNATTPSYKLWIEKWNGSTWVEQTSVIVNGTKQAGPFGGPGDHAIFTIQGSVTYTDNTGGTTVAGLRARVSNYTAPTYSGTLQSITETQRLSITSTEG